MFSRNSRMALILAAVACAMSQASQAEAPLAAAPSHPLPVLQRQPTAAAVIAEHLDALNKCDWSRLMAQGGLCGAKFVPEHTFVVGDTVSVQWVLTADFLLEPYRGSDAYITRDGLMAAIVTSFQRAQLKTKPSPP